MYRTYVTTPAPVLWSPVGHLFTQMNGLDNNNYWKKCNALSFYLFVHLIAFSTICKNIWNKIITVACATSICYSYKHMSIHELLVLENWLSWELK